MKLTTLAPAALLLIAGTAIAQDDSAAGATARDQVNPRAETGTLNSEAHAQGGAHADFATADTDKDGRLSVAELQVVMPDVTITDTDADGYISQSEAEASISGLAFESGEDDGDITETEYEEIVALMGNSGAAGAGAGANAGRGLGADGDVPGQGGPNADDSLDTETDVEIETDAGSDN